MSDSPENKKQQIKDLDGLAYWIGSVDTTLNTLTNLLQDLIKAEDSKWDEFRRWRDTVNQRLADGSKTMSEQSSQIALLVDNIERLKGGVHDHVQNVNIHKEHKNRNGNDNLKQYVSWTWIRDKILVPVVVWGIILFLGYLVVNSIQIQ